MKTRFYWDSNHFPLITTLTRIRMHVLSRFIGHYLDYLSLEGSGSCILRRDHEPMNQNIVFFSHGEAHLDKDA